MLKRILNMDIGALLRTEIPLPFRSPKTESKSPMEVRNPLLDLNVKRVIDTHMAWLTRLKGVIDGTNPEILDINMISVPNQCELGAWIYQENTTPLHTNPEYAELRVAHKIFHQLAGEVLQELSRGYKSSALGILQGDLRKNSDQIQLLLIRLHAQK